MFNMISPNTKRLRSGKHNEIDQWRLAQGHHYNRIGLLLNRAGIGGVEVAKHHIQLTYNIVNKAT
jgi:tRNA G37 N-methylase TrmD